MFLKGLTARARHRKLRMQNRVLLCILLRVLRVYDIKSNQIFNSLPPAWEQSYQAQQNALRKGREVLEKRYTSLCSTRKPK